MRQQCLPPALPTPALPAHASALYDAKHIVVLDEPELSTQIFIAQSSLAAERFKSVRPSGSQEPRTHCPCTVCAIRLRSITPSAACSAASPQPPRSIPTVLDNVLAVEPNSPPPQQRARQITFCARRETISCAP